MCCEHRHAGVRLRLGGHWCRLFRESLFPLFSTPTPELFRHFLTAFKYLYFLGKILALAYN